MVKTPSATLASFPLQNNMSKLLQLLSQINHPLSFPKHYRPFVVEGQQIGLIRPDVHKEISEHPGVFNVAPGGVSFAKDLDDYWGRTRAMENFLRHLRSSDRFPILNGWRDERFEVKKDFWRRPLFEMERSATGLFGVKRYGASMNGYVKHPEMGLCLWLQKRSRRGRWPGLWDTMVGGGIAAGQTVMQTVYKEAVEEADIPKRFHKDIISAGTVCGLFETEDGIAPTTCFVFDLELPPDFAPRNNDGEVERFELVPVDEAIDIVIRGKFKKTVISVCVDFFVRHSVITPNNDLHYPNIVEMLHMDLQRLYDKM